MKNVVNEKPRLEQHGRTKFNIDFVSKADMVNKSILDVGCGYGWFELACVNKKCFKVVGIEPSEKDLLTARKNIKNPQIKFIKGSALSLPFNDNQFDTVVSWEVIEHIPQKTERQMFKEISRVLKPNGTFYLSTPNKSFFSNVFDPAWWLTGHRHYSLKKIKEIGKKSNFKITDSIIKGAWWEIFYVLNLYISKWIFRRDQFFVNYFNKKVDQEFKNKIGFTTVFCKFVNKK